MMVTTHAQFRLKSVQGPVSEFHKAFRLYESQDENAWRRTPVPVIATRVRLQSTQWHFYCFWRHSSPVYFEKSSIWCPTERPLKILDCGWIWLKLVSEGENELIINEICTTLAHNDILVVFAGHFLELLMHFYAPGSRTLKRTYLPNFDVKYFKFQHELTTFPLFQAWYWSSQHD